MQLLSEAVVYLVHLRVIFFLDLLKFLDFLLYLSLDLLRVVGCYLCSIRRDLEVLKYRTSNLAFLAVFHFFELFQGHITHRLNLDLRSLLHTLFLFSLEDGTEHGGFPRLVLVHDTATAIRHLDDLGFIIFN